jgi:hypothetical protein
MVVKPDKMPLVSASMLCGNQTAQWFADEIGGRITQQTAH